MAKEDLRNIGYVCKEHAPKAGKFKGQDPKTFIGKYAKLGFPSKEGVLEHMWVKDIKLDDKHGHELQGILDNDPVYVVGYVCGDGVAFNVDEIEAIDEDQTGGSNEQQPELGQVPPGKVRQRTGVQIKDR